MQSIMSDTIKMTPKEIAAHVGAALDLNVTPKACRCFWRSHVEALGGTVGIDTPGSGARYDFEVTPADLDAIVQAYARRRRTNNAMTVSASAWLPPADEATDDGASV